MSFYKVISNEILKKFNPKKLKLHEPFFSKTEIDYVVKCIKSGHVSSSDKGHYIKKLQNQVKQFTNSKYAVCTINGVSGIHASLLALNVQKNEEVLVPSLTFVASVHPILYLGAVPHFVDVEKDNLGICPKRLELYLKKITYKKGRSLVNKKTKRKITAIIAVHVFGNPCKIKEIKLVAKKYNLKLVEDSTEALGSYYKKKHVGTFGDTGIFSFNGNKIITSGGGGVVVTDNKKIFKKISLLISNSKEPHKWEYIHNQTGYNYRMPNLNAALASAQFTKLKEILKSKVKIFKIYKKMFSRYREIKLLTIHERFQSNNWLNTLIIKDTKLKKNNFIKYLHKKKIYVRPAWKPLHTLKHLKKFPKMSLKTTDKIYRSSISLPSGPGILKSN
tara:strand:- start:604 stop:1770 length:1167 start_codon:yes stop_codon:yes gene_type:complete